MATENDFPEYQFIRDHIDDQIKQQTRREQVATYYGVQPEPKPNDDSDIDWMGWVSDFHDLDWSIVPLDWKPGDPRDPDAEAREQERAVRRKRVAAFMAGVRQDVANVRGRSNPPCGRGAGSHLEKQPRRPINLASADTAHAPGRRRAFRYPRTSPRSLDEDF